MLRLEALRGIVPPIITPLNDEIESPRMALPFRTVTAEEEPGIKAALADFGITPRR